MLTKDTREVFTPSPVNPTGVAEFGFRIAVFTLDEAGWFQPSSRVLDEVDLIQPSGQRDCGCVRRRQK
jgi:hypothetical protein